ncbi:MAG TPA: 7TM diverse intracellular signaling domain-containing protein [Ramlibacter sp.]|nr:7TM diverse intracellular signaling domain-containing protein [Ramlibacter sp.]
MLVAMLLMAAGPRCAFAGRVIPLDSAHQPVLLGDQGQGWVDPEGQMSTEDAADGTAITWTPTKPDEIHTLSAKSVLWIRFTLSVPSAERWYLQVPYPQLDRITLFPLEGVGAWGQSAGDTLAVQDWPVPHRFPLLPLAPGQQEYLVRIQNTHSFGAPIQFVSESYLLRDEQQASVLLGIYFGLAGLAVILAVMSAVSLRDTSYALYAISVAFMALTQASITGIAGLDLWPDSPWWNDYSALILPVLGVGSLQWFFSEVVSMPQRSRLLHYLLVFVGICAIGAAVAITMVDPSHRVRVMIIYIAVAGTIGLAALVWAARRGDRWAIWLLLGSLPVAIGAAFPTARAGGLIPLNFWAEHAMQLGMAVELPIVLLILILRSQQRREHSRRLQGFDKIDPATGLMNAQVFEHGLARMMARSQRLKYQSAVLVIDIINADQISRNYGARSAEELPLQVAGRLLAAARDIDQVARLGELRFGMLIEGPLSPEDAASEGPRIVARCLMPFRDKPIDWVAQVRVAQTIVPTQRADSQQVIHRLEGLLANVSPESKRAVFTLTS